MKAYAKTLAPIAPLLICALLPSCAQVSAPTYSSSELGVALTLEHVKIVSLRRVAISNEEPGVGTVAGGIAGGVAGSMIGSGKASIIGAVGGALGGLFLGSQADKGSSSAKALEITFVRTNGQESVLVQPFDGTTFVIGEQVRLISSGHSSRITH